MRLVSDAALPPPERSPGFAQAGQPALALPSPPPASDDARTAARLLLAAGTLLDTLERGAALDARTLREAMTRAFGATDSEGAWVWKDAYEACEAAQLLFLRRHFPAMRARAGSDAQLLRMLGRLYAQYRDASLEGASTFPDGTILDGGRTIARVSYNARVWPPAKWREGQVPLFDPYAK